MSTIIRRDQIGSNVARATAVPVSPEVAPDAGATPEQGSLLSRIGPTALVVAALMGIAAWGHFSHWTMPKFSSLFGASAEPLAEEWCATHNVAEAVCIECNPDLRPARPSFGWCKTHGVHNCTLEHPEVAQLSKPASVSGEMIARAERALALRPRSENNALCRLHDRYIQFASAETLEKVGVEIAVTEERPLVEAISAPGEVTYDETKMAHLASRVTGVVWGAERQVGDRVNAGDVLAYIDSTDVGRAKGELLAAVAQLRLKQTNVERLRPLAADGTVPGFRMREAEAAWDEARIRVQTSEQALVNLGLVVDASTFDKTDIDAIGKRIQFLGLPADMTSKLDAATTTSNLFPIRAPLSGVVVSRHVVEGEAVEAGTVVFAVADTESLWLTLNVKQEDAPFLTPGQTVLFRPSGSGPVEELSGKLAWISTEADDQTRTVAVRAQLPNPHGRLRSNTFGTGRVVLREEPSAVMVPSEAVHWDGTCHVVFVRDQDYFKEDSPKFFHVRSVRVGVKEGDTTEIIAGLLPGEVIASRNSVVLEAQLLKSNLGAGCGCVDGHGH